MKIKETKEGIALEVLVKTSSKKCRIEITTEEVIFFCKKPPYKSKANKELIKVFSNLFELEVKTVAGLSSNKKTLLIKDLNKVNFEQKIKSSRFTKDFPF
jgi:uncharacterized protein (TIGR00251 family)